MFKKNDRLVVFECQFFFFFPDSLLELVLVAKVFKNGDFIFAIFLFADFVAILDAFLKKRVHFFLDLGFIDLVLEFRPFEVHKAFQKVFVHTNREFRVQTVQKISDNLKLIDLFTLMLLFFSI